MIIVKGYCLKYGNTIATHKPVKKSCLMRDPITNRNCGARFGLPVFIKDYFSINHDFPDGVCNIFKRKDGIYVVCTFDNNVDIELIKKTKLGCYVTNVIFNRDNNEIVDGYVRYVNLCTSNIEEIDEIILEEPFKEPITLYKKNEEE